MLRTMCFAAAVIAATCVLASTATAAPIPGTTFVSTEASSPVYLFIDAAYSGPPIFDPWHYSHPLTDLGCSFSPLVAFSEADGSDVTLRIHGWTSGDLYDPNTGEFLGQRDALHAQVLGTVVDSTGNHYTITGTFFDDGFRHVLPGQNYYGIGHVAITGSAGRVVGTAILYRVIEGGDAWSIDFTKIDTCT
jgi:hypothetical protein